MTYLTFLVFVIPRVVVGLELVEAALDLSHYVPLPCGFVRCCKLDDNVSNFVTFACLPLAVVTCVLTPCDAAATIR